MPLVARVDVDPRGLDEPVEQRRAQHGVVAAHRLGQTRSAAGSGSDGVEAPGVGLGEPRADEDVLERAGGAAARGVR